jgi:hypothetical protein
VLTRGASSVLTEKKIFAELFAMTVGNCKRSIIAQKKIWEPKNNIRIEEF